jgi:hypothetical protein
VATTNPPFRIPLVIKHVGELMRPDGEDDMLHVEPTKFVPVMETAVPTTPVLGLRERVGIGTVKVAVGDSLGVVAVTVYVPEAAFDATVNPPVSAPPAETAHT